MLKKINDVSVKKINLPTVDISKIKGFEFIPTLYTTIFICARRKTGKTTIINTLLKNLTNKETTVIFFVGTINRDPSYKKMMEYLDYKDINYEKYDCIYEGGKNYLAEFMERLKEEHEEEDTDSDSSGDDRNYFCELKYNGIDHVCEDKVCFHKHNNEIRIKVRKPKKIACKYLLIFDDISSQLRNNTLLTKLLKMGRHFKCTVIISSQYIHDLEPQALENIDYYLLLKGHRGEKIKKVYEYSDPVITFENFLQLYKTATQDNYNFFYVDKNNSSYRKNFNEEFIIDDLE